MAEPTSTCICICLFLFLCIYFFRRICFCFRFFRNTSASAAASSSSSSASTLNAPSSSASSLNAPYDVFINHRGPDVKKTLASLLYRDLKSKGLQVFLDQPELEPGHIIRSQIEAAIQGASVHVAIFSEKYAESNWCLDELVLMLDSKGTILPVFYKVKPSDLRWPDKGAYADALRGLEKKKRYDLQIIQGWKKALSSVADISGFELEACNGETTGPKTPVIRCSLGLSGPARSSSATYVASISYSVDSTGSHIWKTEILHATF